MYSDLVGVEEEDRERGEEGDAEDQEPAAVPRKQAPGEPQQRQEHDRRAHAEDLVHEEAQPGERRVLAGRGVPHELEVGEAVR
jgi:hypothetical protein